MQSNPNTVISNVGQFNKVMESNAVTSNPSCQFSKPMESNVNTVISNVGQFDKDTIMESIENTIIANVEEITKDTAMETNEESAEVAAKDGKPRRSKVPNGKGRGKKLKVKITGKKLSLRDENKQLKKKVEELKKEVAQLKKATKKDPKKKEDTTSSKLKTIQEAHSKGNMAATFILDMVNGFGAALTKFSNLTYLKCALLCRKNPQAYDFFRKSDLFKLPPFNTASVVPQRPPTNFHNVAPAVQQDNNVEGDNSTSSSLREVKLASGEVVYVGYY